MEHVMGTHESQDGREVRNFAIAVGIGMAVLAVGEYLGVWRVAIDHASALINHGPIWYWRIRWQG